MIECVINKQTQKRYERELKLEEGNTGGITGNSKERGGSAQEQNHREFTWGCAHWLGGNYDYFSSQVISGGFCTPGQ